MGIHQHIAASVGGTAGVIDSLKTFLESNGWTIDTYVAGVSFNISRSINSATCYWRLARTSTTRITLNGYTGSGLAGGRATALNIDWSNAPSADLVMYSCASAVFFKARDLSNGVRMAGFGRMTTVDPVLGGDVTGAFAFGHSSSTGWNNAAASNNEGMIRVNNAGVGQWADEYTSSAGISNGSSAADTLAEDISQYPNVSGFRALLLPEYATISRSIGYIADDIRVIPFNGITELSQEVVGSDTWLRVFLFVGNTFNNSALVGLALKL